MTRFAALAGGPVQIMGIVNVTPDSFSDGGRFFDPAAAIAHGARLLEEGADILDIGGESTRPGATPVGLDEELRRVIPVLTGLKPLCAEAGARLSLDTRHAVVMGEGLKAGAEIINDVSALSDPGAIPLLAAADCDIVLMHMRGEPGTMQADPRYGDVVGEVEGFLLERVAAGVAGGIDRARLALDPGIGFGKTLEHNLALLRAMPRLAGHGLPLLIGASRKSFIAKLCGDIPADHRLPGSLAAAVLAAQAGAAILRVHDVAATVQALTVAQAIGG